MSSLSVPAATTTTAVVVVKASDSLPKGTKRTAVAADLDTNGAGGSDNGRADDDDNDLLHSVDAAMRKALGVDAFEQRIKRLARDVLELSKESVALDMVVDERVFLAQRQLQKLVIRHWFAHNYTLPHDTSSEGVSIRRGCLLEQLNRALELSTLPRINRRDTLWSEWFLRSVVGVDDQALVNGKPIMLCPRRTINGMVSTLQGVINDLRRGAERACSASAASASSAASVVDVNNNINADDKANGSATGLDDDDDDDDDPDRAIALPHEMATHCYGWIESSGQQQYK